MLETSARLLRLLSLLGSRRFWSGADLAARLEVTERTLRRDIDKLRSLGYPVSSTAGVAGGYHLGAGASMPPLLLDQDEALAVALGLASASWGTIAGMEEAAVRALAKLEQVLPKRLRRRMKDFYRSVTPLHLTGPSVDGAALTALAGACRDTEIVTFTYEDKEGRRSDRRVEPHGLVHATLRWYLAAWDLDREDFRTFRLDRATSVRPSGRRFVPRPLPEGNAAAYVSRSIARAQYAFRARVILHGPYDQVARRISPLAGRLERIDESSCLLESGAQALAPLGLHIAYLGVEFDVLEPPELADELGKLSKRLARAARSARRRRRK